MSAEQNISDTFILILSPDFKIMNNFNKKLYFKYVFPHSHNKHSKQFLHFINKFTVDHNRDIVNSELSETRIFIIDRVRLSCFDSRLFLRSHILTHEEHTVSQL